MAYYGAIAAAAAEKKRRHKLLAEEEDMTQYTQDDLKNDWEFKIVRSDSAVFRKPEVLNRLLEEEAQTGWVMLEKLDDSRIRFKRPRSARAKDAYLPADLDPYRTRYGVPSAQYTKMAVVLGLVLLLALGMAGFFVAGGGDVPIRPGVVTAIPLILIVVGFLVLVKVAARRSR